MPPNMATMLAFYTTDAAVSPELLQKALRAVVPTTYNQMSVDLDTSTNDTLLLLASGLAGNEPVVTEGPEYDKFLAALGAVAEHMCALHASDGEGATHLITCEVTHAPTHEIARAVAKSVVCSNLFKAAVFGRDANWGRILCAIAIRRGIFPSTRSACALPARQARCLCAKMPPIIRSARTKPMRFWASTTSWSKSIWAPAKPAAKPGAAI